MFLSRFVCSLVCLSVCLSVRLSVTWITQKLWINFYEIFRQGIGLWARNNPLDFEGDLNTGIFFFHFVQH